MIESIPADAIADGSGIFVVTSQYGRGHVLRHLGEAASGHAVYRAFHDSGTTLVAGGVATVAVQRSNGFRFIESYMGIGGLHAVAVLGTDPESLNHKLIASGLTLSNTFSVFATSASFQV